MLCPVCDAENSDRATFCTLCLSPMPGLGIHPRPHPTPARVHAAPRTAVAVMSTAAAASYLEDRRLEHEWWVRRREAAQLAGQSGHAPAGVSYVKAARVAQRQYSRGIWWAGALYVVFAWLAIVRAASFDWGGTIVTSGAPSAPAVLSAGLIVLVGAAAASTLSAWVGGPEAWRTTLIGLPFWTFLLAIAYTLVIPAGVPALLAVTVIAIGAAAMMVVAPLQA